MDVHWSGSGTVDDPWMLRTPPLSSEYTLYRDDSDPQLLVCQVGSTRLTYLARAIEDLHAELFTRGDWVPLGAADESKEPAPGTVEEWGRSAENPVGGWYGQRKGYRGRFGMYIPPVLEALGLVELEHNPRNNRVRGDSRLTRTHSPRSSSSTGTSMDCSSTSASFASTSGSIRGPVSESAGASGSKGGDTSVRDCSRRSASGTAFSGASVRSGLSNSGSLLMMHPFGSRGECALRGYPLCSFLELSPSAPKFSAS